MWKNLKIYLSNLGVLGYLGLFVFPPLAWATDLPAGRQVDTAGLLITSHIVRVNQGLREEETFYYGISEEMEIENGNATTYQGNLAFWVGEGEDLRVTAFGEEGDSVNLEALIEEKVATAKLEEEVFIKPVKYPIF
jgi:hypothetical protein